MTLAQLALIGSVVLLGAGPDDPESLVKQLGAPRYAERQAAVQALELLGRQALPALHEARQSPDAEVRARAVELSGRIEAGLLVKPTTVRLDFVDAPLPEVIAALSEQTGIPMALVPENNPIWRGRRITLSEPDPVTFWQALDRLSKVAELRNTVAQGGAIPGRDAVVQLFAGAPAEDVIAHDSGPFRITVEGIHYHLDRRFGTLGRQPVRILQPGGAIVQQPGGDSTTRQFYLDLQVMAEPRMVLGQNGPLKLIEAIDSNGQSLMPDESSDSVVRSAGYMGIGATSTALQMQTHLRYPEKPGATIRRLRGTIPVVVSARKAEPLVIALDDAKGKTYQTEDVSLQIHDVQTDPNQPRTTIDMSIRMLSPEDLSLGGGQRMGMELLAMRSPNVPQSQIEILDAQGRPYRQWFPSSSRVDQEEARMTLTLMNNGEVGPPAQLRFYDMNRATTEVNFEFHDIPMP